MTPLAVGDDEVVLRHIPGGPPWQEPPDGRITSLNFRPRPGEDGLSVSRAGLTAAATLMARLGNPAAGSRIAAAAVADIRALGLEVVPDPIADDPGHALIRPAVALATKTARRDLSVLFRYVPA